MSKRKLTRGTRDNQPRIPVIEIRNWHEYLEKAAGPAYRTWAFRGHSDAEWPLYSSLTRYLLDYGVNRQAWADQEERVVRIFKRKAHLFLEHVPGGDDDFQWLALMQHHGAPTRLLDFTWSPFVAAFFALERATKDAAVWALAMSQIWETHHNFPGVGSVWGDDLNLRKAGNYRRFYLNNKVPFVSYGEPMVMNKRLVAQAGTFVVPGVLDRPVEQILSSYRRTNKMAIKFLLRVDKVRDEAMRSLYNMNITNATLFPDLDGLARSMAYELEFHWAYDPKTMKEYLE